MSFGRQGETMQQALAISPYVTCVILGGEYFYSVNEGKLAVGIFHAFSQKIRFSSTARKLLRTRIAYGYAQVSSLRTWP